jgi:hypothetical protein
MRMTQALEEWFETAMAARNVAMLLTDEAAKAAWQQLADECEATALSAPSLKEES